FFDLISSDSEILKHRLAQSLRLLLRHDVQQSATLNDGFVEQSVCSRHTHERPHFSPTTRLTEDCYIGRVASKLLNIIFNPLQSLHHVQHSHISRLCVFRINSRQIKKTKDIEPMVYRHHYHISFLRQSFSICHGIATTTYMKTSSMQP